MQALPPPEIIAHLVGPKGTCLVAFQYIDTEAGNPTSAQCGKHRHLIARDYHRDSVRRLSRCSIMLMIEGVTLPRLFNVNNCRGDLQWRNVGEVWTRDLLAAAHIAPSRLEGVIYYPIRRRPACYKIAVVFMLPGKTNGPLDERLTRRCYKAANRVSAPRAR